MKNKKRKIILLVSLSLTIALFLIFQLPDIFRKKSAQDRVFRGVAWFRFDKNNALDGWEEKIFKGRVLYSLKRDKTGGYLDAYSRNAASGMLYWLKFNPRKDPYVSWKWKVVTFPQRAKAIDGGGGWLEKDDYAARFYIIFPRFPFFRVQCLEYIWDKDLPLGTILTNPDFRNLKIIVVESGDKNQGQWVQMERNINEDFKKAFGYKPPDAGAIAVMTDADNSASIAQAQYNDIEVGYVKQ